MENSIAKFQTQEFPTYYLFKNSGKITAFKYLLTLNLLQMAKPTKAQSAKVQDAEIISNETTAIEVVQTSFIPAKTGETKPLFNDENKSRLIQAFVNAEVVQFSTTKDEAKKLVAKYKNLVVKDETDEDGYKKVKEAFTILQKKRTSTEAERKEVGKPYDTIKKGIDNFAKSEILEVLAPTEAHLKAEKEKFEKWEQDRLAKLEREESERLDKRVAEIKEAGIVFNQEDGFYTINDINVDIGALKKMKDFDYQALLEKVKIEKQKNDEAAAEVERLRLEQEENDRKQREENERIRKENRAEKLEMRTEKLEALGFVTDEEREMYKFSSGNSYYNWDFDTVAELNKAEFDAKINEHKAVLEKIKEDEIVAITSNNLATRSQVLSALGLYQIGDDLNGYNYYYKGVVVEDVDDEKLGEDDTTQWSERLADIKEQIATIDRNAKIDELNQTVKIEIQDEPNDEVVNLGMGFEDIPQVPREVADKYQDFYNFMNQEHNLILTISEMDEILAEALKLNHKLSK